METQVEVKNHIKSIIKKKHSKINTVIAVNNL